ncbi:glycosyltransferase family 4 protein [Vibrio sp. MMH1-50]|uniref:glycosyltransferase family 4 protein n=1 Tax=Vibrio sp. MMH1-50 TaxID=2917764 RepID=UPI001EF22149|nr:glycosyltransferase family 4 protein [Vibrio sp. MMH1-50]MCG7513138.1 glycosyltransferase family 4 protein [Vibrio sp. MMH1-50]
MSKAICILIPRFKKTGPVEVATILAKEFVDAGNEVHLVSVYDENNAKLNIKEEKIKVKILKSIFKVKELREYIKKEKITVIHSHCMIPDFLNMMLPSDLIRISTSHNFPQLDYCYEYGEIKGKIMAWLHLFAFSHLNNVVGCSESVSINLLELGLKNISTINNGVRIKQDIKDKKIGDKNKALTFVYCGRLIERKNPVLAYKLFQMIANANDEFLVCGDGELMQEMKAIEQRDQRVKILGFIDSPADILEKSDIFISLSYAEGYPMSVLEALSFGCNVIISDIPPHLEIKEKHSKSNCIRIVKLENIGNYEFERNVFPINNDILSEISSVTMAKNYLKIMN